MSLNIIDTPQNSFVFKRYIKNYMLEVIWEHNIMWQLK